MDNPWGRRNPQTVRSPSYSPPHRLRLDQRHCRTRRPRISVLCYFCYFCFSSVGRHTVDAPPAQRAPASQTCWNPGPHVQMKHYPHEYTVTGVRDAAADHGGRGGRSGCGGRDHVLWVLIVVVITEPLTPTPWIATRITPDG